MIPTKMTKMIANIDGLNRLETLGFITRAADRVTKRSYTVQLTDKGIKIADQLIVEHALGLKEMCNLPEDEIREINEKLRLLYEHIYRSDE